MASSSQQLTWLTREQASSLPSHITNLYIHKVSKYNAGNKLGYPFLIFINEDISAPFSVVWHNNRWHKCLHDQNSREPYLGSAKEEVSQFDKAKTVDKDTTDKSMHSE